ncbi:MAG TPA: hypothetical protein PLE19_23400 [Planctomycetota bacterium]|nr:hypothetical protein [Planctomycetota bacterium]HRR81965.1 hypothetical protein [Planctomycetota bacterium]HRT96680.1 hypothetical protein [Planctomycetota bacterium]
MSFTELPHCRSRMHCDACRHDPGFRQSLVEHFGPFECPLTGRMPAVVNLVFDTRPLVVHAPGLAGKNELWQDLQAEFFQTPARQFGPAGDLTILTWNNQAAPGVLQRCLDHLGVPYLVLGQGVKEWKNLHKIRLTREALGGVQTRYVMGLDAADVLVLAHPLAVLERFQREFSCRLLIGAETHCFPEIAELRRFEDSLPGATSPWRYLNSGMWIGETAFCRGFFAAAAEAEPWPGDERFLRSDQGVLKKLLRRFYPDVLLDTQCRLFQNINLPRGEEAAWVGLESRLSRVTAVLLNWKRPQNLPKVLDSLARQTAKPVIFLWNNGAPFQDERVRWQVDSSENMGCWPRWFMASRAATEFVCSLDDDLVLKDEFVLEDALAFLGQCDPNAVIGPEGVKLVFGKPYRHCEHVAQPGEDTPVSIIKGRMMLFRRSALNRVTFTTAFDVARDADDIALSSMLAGGKPGRHIVPALFRGRLGDLEQMGVGLNQRPGHHERREAARNRYFTD